VKSGLASLNTHLSQAMCRFIDDPKLVKPMGARSREIAEEKFDVHKVNKVMLEAMGVLGKEEG